MRKLRTIAAPFIVALPTGTSTRTRVFVTGEEAAALTAIGTHLGSLFRADLAERVRQGQLTAKQKAQSRATRKRELTAVSSSRWAGAITRAVEDQYQLGMRALLAERQTLTAAVETIRARAAAPLHGEAWAGDRPKAKGYRDRAERHQKTRRAVALEHRLNDVNARIDAGHPRITVGSGRLLRTRQNLADAGLTLPQWRDRWDASRMFLTADGESGKRFGNETIRVTTDGTLEVKVPAPLVPQFGDRLRIGAPVQFHSRADEHAERVAEDRAVAYTISYDPGKDRWYLTASWGYKDVPVIPLSAATAGNVVGVDLNADHLAVAVIDKTGNPVGTPHIIPLDVHGLPASTADGHLRAALSELLRFATSVGATGIAVENLNFADARATGRETMGRGRRGKRFRRTVAGIPTGKFRDRLVAMAANRGIPIIAVDPAYTSRWGREHWQRPLQTHASRTATVTGHMAAAVAIGRRAHGHGIRRRPDGLRSHQRKTANHRPATRPEPCPGRVSITRTRHAPQPRAVTAHRPPG